MSEKLNPEDAAILQDLTVKAGGDMVEALERVLHIAPQEARISIVIQVAFHMVTYAASALELLSRTHKGGPEVPSAADRAGIARELAAAFGRYPDLAAMDQDVLALLKRLGFATKGE